MRLNLRAIATALSAFAVCGCATTFKGRMLTAMGTSAAAGMAVGFSKPESKTANALLWGAVGATTAAVVTLLISDPDSETERYKMEARRLREELDLLNSPKIEKQSTGLFGNKVPEKYRELINPGEWKVSRLDEWLEDDENRLIHHDLLMELTPPHLSPISKPTNKKDSNHVE
jgi:hypothetical protein